MNLILKYLSINYNQNQKKIGTENRLPGSIKTEQFPILCCSKCILYFVIFGEMYSPPTINTPLL